MFVYVCARLYACAQHMEVYGSAGLRTLCLSYAELDPLFYAGWQNVWQQAKTAMEAREQQLEEAAELIEKNLQLLGCVVGIRIRVKYRD